MEGGTEGVLVIQNRLKRPINGAVILINKTGMACRVKMVEKSDGGKVMEEALVEEQQGVLERLEWVGARLDIVTIAGPLRWWA